MAAVEAVITGYRLAMLKRLHRTARVNAARVLVALYALCIVMPVAGFAFGDSAAALHCLTDVSPDMMQRQHSGHGNAEAHQSHADHVHHAIAVADDSDASVDHAGMKGHAGKPACCGVMCVSALPADLVELALRTVTPASIVTSSDAGIRGKAPDRLYRPPIVLLSL